jgi:hypothetical protein
VIQSKTVFCLDEAGAENKTCKEAKLKEMRLLKHKNQRAMGQLTEQWPDLEKSIDNNRFKHGAKASRRMDERFDNTTQYQKIKRASYCSPDVQR